MECEFCKNTYSCKSSLNYHQKNSRSCLKLQGKNNSGIQCIYCNKNISTRKYLKNHLLICKVKCDIDKKKYREQEIETLSENYTRHLSDKDQQIQKLDNQVRVLQDKLENVAIHSFTAFEKEATIDIVVEEKKDTKQEGGEDENYEYVIDTDDSKEEFTIDHRTEDGYINATNLCNAGNKKFKDWKRVRKTFLQVLSSSTRVPVDSLIKYENSIWVHPQVAIDVSQWISPEFSVKISAWMYETMMTGRVDITNTRDYKQLQQENKNQQLRIRYLTKKYVKKQPRQQYTDKNVIYILTTDNMKKERLYILGKATNLTNRLSTYNKTDEHEVVFYGPCPDKEKMKVVEDMVFLKLGQYREQANRERFILPEEQDISLFVDEIKKCIQFVK